MGTRRRDFQRRQVSLTVEALEDRFLLSGTVSLSTPAAANEPSPSIAAVPGSAWKNETPSASAQMATGQIPVGQPSTIASKNALIINHLPFFMHDPIRPMMVNQRDQDGDDDDPPGIADEDASPRVASRILLPSSPVNNGVVGFDPQQMTLPAVKPIPFLPLLSACGFGAAGIVPVVPSSSATRVSENAPEIHDRAPSNEELLPRPRIPQAPPTLLPPLVDEHDRPTPPSSSEGPFAELLPIDLESLQCGVEVFFRQLGNLSDEWRDGQVLEKLASWLLAASIVGYGWIRLHDNKYHRLAGLFAAGQPETTPTFFQPGGKE